MTKIFDIFLIFINRFSNFFLSILIFEKKENVDLTLHSQSTFLLEELYPLNIQLFSHKDILLLLYSFFLSYNVISVLFTVVYGIHISL